MDARTRLIGPPPLEVRLVGVGGLCVFAVIATLVSLTDSIDGGGRSFLLWGTSLTTWVWLHLLIATSHIAVRDRDLVFVDVIIERAVPAAEVLGAYGDDGVGVELRRGGSIGSAAYGSSLPQALRPYRRYLDLADAIDAWVHATSAVPTPRRRRSRVVRWQLRRSACHILVVSAAGSYLWMLLLWLFADVLRPLVGIRG
ncbi:hypothetical protein [Georgenia sp. Marseille-Q6866]